MPGTFNTIYYFVKPLLPRRLQLWLRRRGLSRKKRRHAAAWPILERAGKRPEGWAGWPENKQFSVVLTHDVERQGGHDKCLQLAELEKSLGFRSLFNFVPERYEVSAGLRATLVAQGFEVGVHGLNHDGKLFQSLKIFRQRVPKINGYLRDWQSVGFRSPAMLHNLDWIRELDIEYDLSTFDTDPFEPQSDGVETIFPFWVDGADGRPGYVEMPYTLAQDFTPLILMREQNIDFWKKKIDWISTKGGMVLVNVHPDYICFEGKPGFEEFPVEKYAALLSYLRENYAGRFWHVLPREMARFWRQTMVSKAKTTFLLEK